ncbi:MAG: SDR family NAD(P)-dependent oxidoreductase [Oscillospiraceae bacterium]
MKTSWLNNKTVIITGASSGIGREITLSLIRDYNCNVVGVARSELKMAALIEELGDLSDKFSYRLFDVAQNKNWESFAKYLEESSINPDILINDAGILPRFARFEKYTIEEAENAMKINFFSCVYAVHSMLPIIMRSKSPAIINVDSSAALMSLAGTSMYSASKAALKAFTEALREECRGKCYVAIICPGFTKTSIFRNQNKEGADKAFEMIATPCDKMVKKIMRGIKSKRRLMVFGKDAILMNYFGRLMPVKGSKLFSKAMEISKLPLFDDIFKE